MAVCYDLLPDLKNIQVKQSIDECLILLNMKINRSEDNLLWPNLTFESINIDKIVQEKSLFIGRNQNEVVHQDNGFYLGVVKV